MLPRKLIAAGALSLAMSAPAIAEEHMVIVTGFSYFPAITYAQPGDSIRFINQSGGPEIVVGRNTGWFIVLGTDGEGELVVEEETELLFFSAYQALCEFFTGEDAENCGPEDNDTTTSTVVDNTGSATTTTSNTGTSGSASDPAAGDSDDENPFGNYEDAEIKAEITFEAPVLEADESENF